MKKSFVAALLAGVSAFGQKPSDPKLLIPQEAPALALEFVPNNGLQQPANFGLPGNVKFDSKGNLWVLNRGAAPVTEFDANGKLILQFGEGLFGNRPHAVNVDPEGNIWVSDGSTHILVKFDPAGKQLFTLGTKGKAGAWDEAAGTQLLNQPNEVAFGRNGDVFLVEGHTPGAMGDPRVLKFDKNGKFIKQWGGKGSEPGKFQVAHGIAIDSKGQLWVTDRENSRIQIFDQDGNYQRELKYAGLPCAIEFHSDAIWMVNGFTGQILKLDLDGKVLGVFGKPGTGPDEFGEAHYLTVSPKGEIYIADVTKGVMKFVVKK
ncbi:MAG: peptidyl-alpha-hydroxyglycine alpha-amidating lyase family protein [Acidobacteriota bacterium]